ncbi:DUF7059 domain-containing protein [Nocardioides sp. B-3]|uniref:DUF7059 domain-containing protein n=1 Tax=Nocardioides sp. B-3 TaxID=2895565 RepID=UPI00300E1E30
MTGDVAPELSPAIDLRAALVAAEFTYDAVAEVLGDRGHRALSRNETTPGVRRTADGSALSTLTRLFLLQTPTSHAEAERALPGPGRSTVQRRPAGAERRRGRGPDGLPALLQRRRRPVGRLRPDARPRRGAHAGRLRPRARHLQRVDLAGSADRPRRSRSRPRTSGRVAAYKRCTSRRMCVTSSRPM